MRCRACPGLAGPGLAARPEQLGATGSWTVSGPIRHYYCAPVRESEFGRTELPKIALI